MKASRSGLVPPEPPASVDETQIRALLATYQDALNASSTAAVMPLYATDGVFMPPFSPSAVGTAAVRQAYETVFEEITLQVTFTVVEWVKTSPEWAFARTSSAGTNRINATGVISAEGNQELFIFHKEADSRWRIARYSFSPTNRPRP